MTMYNPHVQCIDPGIEREPDVTFGSSKIELRSPIVGFFNLPIYLPNVFICFYIYVYLKLSMCISFDIVYVHSLYFPRC